MRGQMVSATEHIKQYLANGKPIPNVLSNLIAATDIAANIWVYRQPDLEETHRQVVEATDLWEDFARYLWAEEQPRVEEARHRLFGHAAIRSVIDQSRADGGEPPLPPIQ
jgi:hypothetical protein